MKVEHGDQGSDEGIQLGSRQWLHLRLKNSDTHSTDIPLELSTIPGPPQQKHHWDHESKSQCIMGNRPAANRGSREVEVQEKWSWRGSLKKEPRNKKTVIQRTQTCGRKLKSSWADKKVLICLANMERSWREGRGNWCQAMGEHTRKSLFSVWKHPSENNYGEMSGWGHRELGVLSLSIGSGEAACAGESDWGVQLCSSTGNRVLTAVLYVTTRLPRYHLTLRRSLIVNTENRHDR